MKKSSINISERQQVLLVIPIAVGAMLAIWFLVLKPQFERRNEIASLRSQLNSSPYAAQSMSNLLVIADHERKSGDEAKKEWAETIKRLSTFANAADMPSENVGRIDYKMELFKARTALSSRSEQLGVQLVPQDLGLRDLLGGGVDEVKRSYYQLKTVERLVDTILDRKVYKLHSITPFDPEIHRNLEGNKLLFTEYPVEVVFEIAFEHLYLFYQAVLAENSVFFIRNIEISAGTAQGAPLKVKAVMSSVIFE